MSPLQPALAVLDDRRVVVRVAARAACALAGAAVAFWIIRALASATGGTYLFAAFPFVLAVGFAAGTVAGLTMVAVLVAALAYTVFAPFEVFAIEERAQAFRLLGFGISAALVAAVAGALRAAYRRAARTRREAESQAASLRRLQESRDDLLRALSHDVRTPLSIIVNHAELLRRSADAGDVLRRADAIGTSARRIAAMVSDLVETLQLESEQITLRRSRVELVPYLTELLLRLEGTLPVDRIRLALSPRALAVEADPDRLERIVVNLLSNAFKYSPLDAPVVLGSEPAGAEVALTVADRGPGIRAEDLEHLFERFYRGAGARAAEGLGLGLYITRLLAEAHGGRVTVETSEAGSTFRVVLPAPARASAPDPEGMAPASLGR